MSTQPLRIALAGREHVVDAGTTAGAVLAEAGLGEQTPGAHAVIAARVNGELRDLNREVADGDVIEPVRIDDPDGRAILRHSTTHVMAQAVQDLFPEAKLGIGPPIENGFYYDFDTDRAFDPVFHPKGAIIRQVMENYSRGRHEASGYQYVNTPHVTKAELFEISGHLEAVSFRYRDGAQKNGVPIGDAVAEIVTAVRDRIQM